MVGLRFQTILPTGSRELGDTKGTGGVGILDLFFENINLPGFVNGPALIVLAARLVDHEKNFLTINPPPEVVDQTFDEAEGTHYFIWRVLPNPSDTWILQVHPINPARLNPTGNVLGIHTRDDKGQHLGACDGFEVARIFLVYHSA